MNLLGFFFSDGYNKVAYMCAYVMKSHLHGALRENKLILYWLTIMAALPTVKKKKATTFSI